MPQPQTIAILALLCALLVVTVVGGLLLNRKLNRSHLAQLRRESSASAHMIHRIEEVRIAQLSTRASRPQYEFDTWASISPSPYDPRGKYFLWDAVEPISDTKDAHGVHLIHRAELEGGSHHPVAISQYGLGQFGNYVATGEQAFLEEARAQADYLAGSIDPDSGMFWYDFDFPVRYNEKLSTPWGSAMAQGEAISLLMRFYALTGDESYLTASRLALLPLTVGVPDGGLRADLFGHPYYEEYPTRLPTFTLNGFMFALIGLYDLWAIGGDKTAKDMFEAGIETLVFCLPFYDLDGISLYWLSHIHGQGVPLHFSSKYHLIHVKQLHVFNQLHPDKTIDFYLNRWIGYVNKP